MSTMPAIVFIVVDHDYAARLADLPTDEPVWIVDTPTNRAMTKKLWAESPNRTHLNGITLFTSTAASAEDCVIHQLEPIDLHHGIYSADPPYAGLQIIGTQPTDRLTVELAAFDLTEITITDSGFRATRPTYNTFMPPEDHEQTIRQARAHSNRSIARRNLLGVGSSLADDFVAIIGDGTFVPTRAAYLKLFKFGFDNPKASLTYERIPDTIQIATPPNQAAELGTWIATTVTGTVTHTGTYAAMWRQTPAGWQLRSELYITLTEA